MCYNIVEIQSFPKCLSQFRGLAYDSDVRFAYHQQSSDYDVRSSNKNVDSRGGNISTKRTSIRN